MPKTRTPIPSELAAEVMVGSDRTCCVCRIPHRRTEIHHIDGDPSNNDRANLAVVCKDHQSDAHTDHAFARNLTPDMIRLYDETWRAIVRARLSLGGDQSLETEYQQQVLLEISLAPHAWKNHYMRLYPGHFHGLNYSSADRGGDVWDMLSECATHQYSIDEWKKYVPLFDGAIKCVVARLNGILVAHGDVVPVAIKLAALRDNSQLESEGYVYLQLPGLVRWVDDSAKNTMFAARFQGAIVRLSSIARLADQERKALLPDT